MQNSPYRKPFIFAIALHLILFIALFWHLSSPQLQQLPVQPDVDIIKAIAVSPPKTKPQPQIVNPKIEAQKKQQELAEQKQQQEKIEQAQAHILHQQQIKQKLAQEQQKQAQAAALKSKQLLEKTKPIEKPAVKKPEPDKEIQEVIKKPEPKKIEKAPSEPVVVKKESKNSALLSEINEEKIEQKKAAEQLKLTQQKELQEQIAAEKTDLEAARTNQQQSEIEKYKALIEQAISQHWVVPGGSNPDLSCTLLIKVGDGGTVINVQIARSSGDTGLDNSARSAVFKASPLPVPDDVDLFSQFRQMRLTVKPENVAPQE